MDERHGIRLVRQRLPHQWVFTAEGVAVLAIVRLVER
jgi:hypothetical protein